MELARHKCGSLFAAVPRSGLTIELVPTYKVGGGSTSRLIHEHRHDTPQRYTQSHESHNSAAMNTVSSPPLPDCPVRCEVRVANNDVGQILLVSPPPHLPLTARTSHTRRVGWGSLVVAGAGAYYFAKKEIDADRRAKHLEIQRKQCKSPDSLPCPPTRYRLRPRQFPTPIHSQKPPSYYRLEPYR